jgi:hypothetical protein
LGDTERQTGFMGSDQLCHRLSMPGNHDALALLDQLEEPGELGLSFVDVDLHILKVSLFF